MHYSVTIIDGFKSGGSPHLDTQLERLGAIIATYEEKLRIEFDVHYPVGEEPDYFEDYEFEEGKGWGIWHNPDGKWDYWKIGGRYRGLFIVKPGTPDSDYYLSDSDWDSGPLPRGVILADICYKKDIDMEAMVIRDKERRAANWKEAEEKAYLPPSWYGIKKGATKEEHINDPTPPVRTYAYLDENGWRERGFLFQSEKDEVESQKLWSEKFMAWFDALDPIQILTIVDCHI